MIRLVAFQAILCCAMAAGQARSAPQPQLLEPSGEKVLSVPAFGFFGTARSDSAGDVFIHPAPFEETYILKISQSSETAVYKLPPDVASKTSFYDYSVTPSGAVWVLVNETGSPQLRAVELDGEGRIKSTIRLEMPNAVEATNFLALENDFVIVSGSYTDDAPKGLSGHRFLGLFDNSGNLVRNITNGLEPANRNDPQGYPPKEAARPGTTATPILSPITRFSLSAPVGRSSNVFVSRNPIQI